VEVCPGKIDIPGLIVEVRRKQVKEQGQPLVQKAIFKVVNDRRLFHGLLRAASLAQKPFEKDGFIRHLPMFLSGLAGHRSLPAVAEVPFRDEIRTIVQPKSDRKVAFYAGCLIDFAYPGTGRSVVDVLNRAGVEVVFPEAQTCCGAPARFSGAYDVAAQNAIDNIRAFDGLDVEAVVSACPTCTAALKHEFVAALRTERLSEWLPKAEALAAKVVDFSSYVTRLVAEGRLTIPEGTSLPAVTYHDSCHLKRTLHVTKEPRALLAKAGFPLAEMDESDMCCGMGGSYSVKFPEISAPILQRKLSNVKKTGAGTVAMDCPGCLMQIRGGLDKERSAIRVSHLADLLAARLRG
jgi:Fe-S oxidoreductase